MARTRRVRLYSADHRWSKGLSAAPRTSQDKPAKGARRPPFSRTSTGAAAANSRRVASNSAASSTREIIEEVTSIVVLLTGNHWLDGAKSKPVTRTAGRCMFHELGM